MQESNRNVDSAVIDYLKRKGYRRALMYLQEDMTLESSNDPEQMAQNIEKDGDENLRSVFIPKYFTSIDLLVNIIGFHNDEENYPRIYEESYSAFKEWAETSLDRYKPELLSVLYPLFVHAFLDLMERGHSIEARQFLIRHRADHLPREQHAVSLLSVIQLPEHVAQNSFARDIRANKLQLSMSQYGFQLLLAYLHERKFMLLLSILNSYVRVKVIPGQPKIQTTSAMVEPLAITGETLEALDQLHKTELKWHLFASQLTYAGLSEVDQTSRVPLPNHSQKIAMEIFEDLTKQVKLSRDLKPSICLYTLFNTHDRLNVVQFNRRGNLVAGGFSDSQIRLWDLTQDSSTWTRFSERYFSEDGRNEFYRPPATDSPFHTLIGHSGSVFGLSFSPDGNYLLSCSQDASVRLWSTVTKTSVAVYRGHVHPIWDVAFAPQGCYFATASNDRTARLWVTHQLEPLRIFAGHLSDVNCVRFHPNCNYIITGSSDCCLRMWEIHTGNTVRLFTGHSAPIHAIAVSPNGKYVASGSEDGLILLWDLSTSERIATLEGHSGSIWSLDFSSNGSLLASGSQDKTLRVWDVSSISSAAVESKAKPSESDPSPYLISTFPTKKTPVFNVSFTTTNLLLAAGRYSPGDNVSSSDVPVIDQQ